MGLRAWGTRRPAPARGLHGPNPADNLLFKVPFPRPSRAPGVRLGVLAFAFLTVAVDLRAQPAPGGDGGTLGRARAAWDRAEFDVAETLYKEAIERGGLERGPLLDAYVRLGSARAVSGKRDLAMAAFRRAALLDPKFAVPPEAGKKVGQLAETARKEEARIGPVVLKIKVPRSAPAGVPFRVDATLDAAHTAIVGKLTVEARDGIGGQAFSASQPPATEVHFDLPGKVAMPDADLVVRVTALDAQDNQLALASDHVRVGPATEAAPAPIARAPRASTDPAADGGAGKKGSFWASPWPYVVGGLALAAGGAALYVFTRPGDEVTIGAARVEVGR